MLATARRTACSALIDGRNCMSRAAKALSHECDVL
jgi:hypothetical protein